MTARITRPAAPAAFSSPADQATAEAILAGIEPPVTDPNARPNRPTARAARRKLAEERAAARAAGTSDKPPKTPRAPGGSVPRAGTARAHVAASVEGLHLMGAAVAPLLGKPQTGEILAATAKDAGQAWAELSVRYPAVARILSGGGDAMLVFNLLMIYMPVVMTAVNEKRDPATSADLGGLLGTVLGGGGAAPAAAAA